MKVKYILIIFFLVMILTGCTKSELNMDIDSNGNVKIIHTVLVNDSDYDFISNIIKEDREKFDYNKYSVEKISINGTTGYKIEKEIGNIVDLGENENDAVDLNKYASNEFNDKLLFTDVKRLFTNKYVANYKIDLTNIDKAVMYLPIFNGSVYTSSDAENTLLNDKEIEKLNSEVETTFVLSSKLNIGKNNATENDNGEYVWELKYGVINNIYFEVDRINVGSLVAGCVLALTIGVYYLVTNTRKIRLHKYNSVTLKESLDLEYRTEKRNQIRDIRLKRKYNKENEINDDEAYSINERIHQNATSIGAYSNLETIEKLNDRIIGNNKKEIVPLSEQKDPEFKSVNSQVMEVIEKEKEDNKFVDK